MTGRLQPPILSSRSVALLLVAIVLAGAALRAGAAMSHERVDFDEGRYLDNAVSLLEGQGLATHTVSLFFGDPPRPPRPEDISSPLYPLILAAIFAVTGASFPLAKALTVLTSVAMIPAAFLLGRRLFGAGTGLAAAALLALQPDQAIVGSWAMTEPLYGLLILASLLVMVPIVTEGGWTWKRAVGAGLMCGILYLSRQNGAAVAAGMALVALADPAGKGGAIPRRIGLVTVMTLTALALSLPWFLRNEARFGSPTFSRLGNVAWADQARSLYDPSVEAPTLGTFVEKHGMEGLARNLGTRVLRVGRHLLTAEAGPFRWIAILGLVAPLVPALRARSWLLWLPAILTAVLLLGVAPWSGAIPRYLLPVRALLYLGGAALLLHLGERALARLSLEGRGATVAAAIVLAMLGWAMLSSADVYASYLARDESDRHAAAVEAAGWIARETGPGEVLLEGGLLHQYAWIFRRGVVWIPLGDMATVRDIAERYRASYLAATPEALRFRPGLADHWEIDGRRLSPRDVPAWLVPVYDRGASGVIIYRIEERTEREAPEGSGGQ